ncbi:unnamed protein product [Pylaiella littoralis]
MEEGAQVWASGGEKLWEPGVVKKKTAVGDSFDIEVLLSKGGKQVYTVSGREEDDSENLKLRNVAGQSSVIEGSNVADLTSLTYLHEPAILFSLRERYQKDIIYTYTGPILLAVNPFKAVNLYTDKLLKAYKVDGERRSFDPNFVETKPPHVYAIADKAYRNMTVPSTEYSQRSQSIMVSGESGAGKTETCKIIMKYLAILGNAAGDGNKLGTIEKRILKSNPILEAFGNARTVRNDNSSRFGKYIQLLFSDRGKLSGAAIKTFLLEKIRVVKQSNLERNYHIFYIMVAGASAKERESWELQPAQAYHYMNQSGCYDRRDGVKDIDLHVELQEAFSTMGFDRAAQNDCLGCVASILALGNLEFEQIPGARDDEQQARLNESSGKAMKTAARMLGVSAEALLHCLTARKVTAGTTHVTIFLTPEQSAHARDAMAKALYAATFAWVVAHTNKSIQGEEASSSAAGDVVGGVGGAEFNTDKMFIGLLDIFGFEVFADNFYEQFLINYANEVLQQQFNDFVFRQEQEEYRREQLEWTFIHFPDNADCITLIEKKPNGIIPTLDEQCIIGKATDDRFARELYKKSESNSRFFLTPKMRVDHLFGIKHYAGEVVYDTRGIIEKNRDNLPQEGVDLLMSSETSFTVLLGKIEANKNATPGKDGSSGSNASTPKSSGRRGGVGGRSTIGAKSLGTQFKENLNNLLGVVNLTHPHYVRCIKPNDQLVPAKFNYVRIAEQLRNAGVLEVVRVARAGFPVRLGVHEFVERYALLGARVVEVAYRRAAHDAELDQERSVCKALIMAIQEKLKPGSSTAPGGFQEICREQGMQMGLTKVFFQQKAFNSIEKLRTTIVSRSATIVQTFWRGVSCRRAFLIRKGLLAAGDGSRRLRGLAACRIQRLARRYIWTATKGRREAAARAEREAQLVAQMEELRIKMQGEINELRAELVEAKQLAKQGQALAKRVVVVCGGANGIGPAIASRLVKEGAKVVVVDENAASAKGKVKGLDGADAPESAAVYVDANVADESSVKKALAQAIKVFGRIDGLVNVPPPPPASNIKAHGVLNDVNLQSYQDMLMAEMHSPLLCAKQASAVMKGVGGSVVFISNAGERALTEGSGNVGAISALTSSAAAAGGPVGIRVNCVTHALGGDEDDESHNSSSGGHGSFSLATMRGPSAEDVAHLLSDKATFVTGQTIAADSVRFCF